MAKSHSVTFSERLTAADLQAIEPVTIEWGSFETLSTVGGLARCLLDQWPAESSGEAYVTALMVCDAVLTGQKDDQPADARAAFVEAANEAGLSVTPDDDFVRRMAKRNPPERVSHPAEAFSHHTCQAEGSGD